MDNFKLIYTGLDTLPILAEIKNDDWKADTYLRDYPQGPFGDTESVILRFPPRTVHETEEAIRSHLAHFDQHENEWQPIAQEYPVTKDVIHWLMRAVNGTRLGRVMINKVAPGGRIDRHADEPVHADYWSRFHIVLHALPGNDFYCGGETINMTTGEVWYFRNDLEHEINNNSGDYRVHLVIDIKTDIEKPKKIVKAKKAKKAKKVYDKGTTYQLESLIDIVEELKPFVPLHHKELGLNRDVIPVDMDWPRYFQMERDSKLQLVTVRKDGVVIGYQFTFIGGHFHYKNTLHGVVDLYYILPEYRVGRIGLRLFQFAEKCMKSIGVVKVVTGTKMHSDNSRLFEFMGYKHTDQQYAKILKD